MFREILKELREDNHDSQADLAQKLDVAKSTISNWEQGKSEPGFEMLCKICDLYDVTADYLLGRRSDDPMQRMKRFESLSDENKKFIRKIENYLLYEQLKTAKKITAD